MTATHVFQTVFAVPMTCGGCAKDVSAALSKVGGITKVDTNVEDQLVSVEGTAAPSVIVAAIQATGRDAILRGSGASNSAAVSILETFDSPPPSVDDGDDEKNRDVRGLARMVQVSPTATLVDLTLRGVAPGRYRATIREFGDLKQGALSTGGVWTRSSPGTGEGPPIGDLGSIDIGDDEQGSVFLDRAFQIWEVIGRALVVTHQEEQPGASLQNDENTVLGVIARSAGVWDNDKTVCSCTGKTLWEERQDEVRKGML